MFSVYFVGELVGEGNEQCVLNACILIIVKDPYNITYVSYIIYKKNLLVRMTLTRHLVEGRWAGVLPPSQVWRLKEYNSHCFSDMSTIE